jgi:hypothetical protein
MKIGVVKAYLKKCSTDIDSLSLKLIGFIEGLRKIDDNIFTTWYEQGKSKKDALKLMVKEDPNNIAEIIRKSWDKKFIELGSVFSFWTGRENEIDNTKLNFRLGVTSKNDFISAFIGISFPYNETLRIEKGSIKEAQIVALIEEVWIPEKIEIE